MTWGRRLTLEDCTKVAPIVAHLKTNPRCHFFPDRDGLWKYTFNETLTDAEHVKANAFCDHMERKKGPWIPLKLFSPRSHS